jgi:hypothetical protein
MNHSSDRKQAMPFLPIARRVTPPARLPLPDGHTPPAARRPMRIRSLVLGPLLASILAGGSASAANFTIHGFVRNEAGQAVAGADLDLIEFCTGTNVVLANDKTLVDGSWSIVVAEGSYDIHFTPPAGSTLAQSELEDVSIHANLDLGTTTLHPGVKLSGTVRNASGQALAAVDLDLVDVATGRKIYLANDLTDATGKYSLRVAPGTYDVEYRPPITTQFITGRRRGLVVTADVTGLVDTLVTGQRVTARVRDSSSNNIANADFDFYDTCAGETIPTAHDNSDTSGNVTVYVPSGTYTITVGPPRCTSLGAFRAANRAVTGNTGLGDVILLACSQVTGRVVDGAAAPVAGVDLNFYDAATGARQATVHDNSDSAGSFSVCVPPGTYDIEFSPPSGSPLRVQRFGPVTASGPTALGDVALPAGTTVTGLVLGPGGAGANNINIDALDSVTRASVLLAHDNADPNGAFAVVMAPGTYDFRYSPPSCSPLAPGEQRGVTLGGSFTVPTMSLVTGTHATGRLMQSAVVPVVGGDLDFFTAGTRNQVFTIRDNSDSSGFYDVLVPPGAYDIDYSPPAGSHLVGAQRFGISLFTNTTIPDTFLHAGSTISGRVLSGSTGLPVSSVSIAVFPSGGATPVFTPHNNTAADGAYGITVDNGLYDLLYQPPGGSGLAPRWLRAVSVVSDTPLSDTLLLPLTVPTVNSVTPGTGTTAGGQALTIAGIGFQADATVMLGGVTAPSVTVASSTSLTVTTPHHPSGFVAVSVINLGAQTGTRTGAFEYREPSSPVRLSLSRSGSSVVLNWIPNGQASYAVFRSAQAGIWTDASILTTTTGSVFTDPGGTPTPGITFYQVD